MGGRTEFEWVYTQNPHDARRKAILKKHPEIKQLMFPDPRFKYITVAMVVFNIVCSYYVGQLPIGWILVLSYCLGGVVNHSLTLAIHEISHNQAFGSSYPLANRLFGIFANFPIGIPISVSFKNYHIEHHRFQGIDTYDTDLPTEFEGRFFYSAPRKALWLFLQPLFYALRPLIIRPKVPTGLEILNVVVQLIFDVILVYYFGWRSLFYLITGTLLAMGLHPLAGHFVAEHYTFKNGYETSSYYGPLNYLTFNVGYHMEHHDFPYIPATRLPHVKRIAPEFYDELPHHTSWVKVMWDFVMDENMGPYARVKRNYEDVLGSNKKHNPYLHVNNTMNPVLGRPSEVETVTNMQEDSAEEESDESDNRKEK